MKSITARASLFVVEETDFSTGGNYFFSSFQRLLSAFLSLVEKYFSTKSFILAGEESFSG